MLIKNITDEKTPKVIGIGKEWLQPGEEKYFPDDILYVPEYDKYGNATGKKVILGAILSQVKLNMLKITETKDFPAEAEAVQDKPVISENDVLEEPVQEEPEKVTEKALAKTTRTRGKAKA